MLHIKRLFGNLKCCRQQVLTVVWAVLWCHLHHGRVYPFYTGHGLYMRCVLTIGVMGLFSCLLAVSNWEPATRSEMSHPYSSSYLTAPLNSLGKTYRDRKMLCLNTVRHRGKYILYSIFPYLSINWRPKSHLAVQSADIIFRCLRGQNAVEFGLNIWI